MDKTKEIEASISEQELSQEKLRRINQFIFDDSKVIHERNFTQDCLKNGDFYFGILLPKEVDIFDKKSLVIGKKQKKIPVLITSRNDLIEVDGQLEKYKIAVPEPPKNLPYRWRLKSIHEWLNSKSEPIHAKEMYEAIRGMYEKYLYFGTPEWYDVHALWDIGTYFFMLFPAYPIFELTGLSTTGKTKIMNLSRELTYNPSRLMVNPSESTLFRDTHRKRYTKYLDEAEKLFRYNKGKLETDDRVELLNASYTKGAVVPKQDKFFGKWETVEFNCYSPTMIGSINGVFGATQTRCITHITTRAPDDDERNNNEVENEPQENWQSLRDQMHVFALQNAKYVWELFQEFKVADEIKARDLQLWKPLLALAHYIDVELYQRIEKFAVKYSSQKKDDFIPQGSFDYKILLTVRGMIEGIESKPSGMLKLYTEEIKKAYVEDHNIDTEKVTSGFNKKISSRLDKLGFKEYRAKDKLGSYFEFSLDVWKNIITPICPDLSSLSSLSSSYRE